MKNKVALVIHGGAGTILKKNMLGQLRKHTNIAMPFNTEGMYRGYIKNN